MANKNFQIRKGIYEVPNVGRIDATKKVSDEKAFAAYMLPRKKFPFIQLTPDGKDFLKKQKLDAKEIARLIKDARNKEEAELLASLSDTKTVEGVLETKLKALKSENK